MYVHSLILIVILNVTYLNSTKNILSRKRRYLVFPEGSSISIAICMTAQMGITPGELFTEGVNWGISYELPNDTKEIHKDLFTHKHVMKRRNRRELYGKIEKILESMGYNGKSCVARAICEAVQYLKPKSGNLVDEILRIVFGFSTRRIFPSEVEVNAHYHKASKMGKNNQNCSEMFSCPFSLIEMALGYYSNYLEPPFS